MKKGEVIKRTERRETLMMSSHNGRFTVDMDIVKDTNGKYSTTVRVLSWYDNNQIRDLVVDDYYDLIELRGFLDKVISEHDDMQSRIPDGKGVLWEKT